MNHNKNKLPVLNFKNMRSLNKTLGWIFILLITVGLNNCAYSNGHKDQPIHFEPNNGGLTLPAGFQAVVVADNIGSARHIVIRDNGDIYVALEHMKNGGGIVAMRDNNGDGKPDVIKYFGNSGGNGIAIHDGYLYFAPDTAVWRYKLTKGQLVPDGTPEHIVVNLPHKGDHHTKSITFDNQGNMYLDIGSPTNACQQPERSKGVPGLDPCPQLKTRAGVWEFKADQKDQKLANAHHYATGIRNGVGITWNSDVNKLYVVQNGRDQLHQLWPKYFTQKQSAELPAEEFMLVKDGSNFGWPYAYYDQFQHKNVLAPEYGGDGQKVGRAANYDDPIMAFPGHWAPLGLMFYTGNQFPSKFKNGAFIAFHGSWNRAPLPQAPGRIVFVPFQGDKPASDKWDNFATGFAGVNQLSSPGQAKHRPVGLAQGPDGSLYVTDDSHGTVWRIMYTGK
ncbi:MAG TPA: PQQ-dependent sugar dehydrogenase [Balneolales bacterium]|nr:PQQ-dependent sugar dehydrogenase [Balneolales bacterium]